MSRTHMETHMSRVFIPDGLDQGGIVMLQNAGIEIDNRSGLKGDDFKAFVETGASDDEIAKWVDRNGTPKSEEEKRAWAEEVMKENPYYNPEKRDWYVEQLQPLGLDPKTTPPFDWLETDDKVSYKKAA